MNTSSSYDAIVIGAGILGAATARSLQLKKPQWRIAILEKEAAAAAHQTGRNSGVIHAGVYYPPGSLKAKLCTEGNRRTKAFCREHQIPVEECGKLLVASDERELAGLERLHERAGQNGLKLESLSAQELKTREPNVQGVAALFVADSAIVDYRKVTNALLQEFTSLGGEVLFQQTVLELSEGPNSVTLKTQNKHYEAEQLISCAGIQSDRIAAMLGLAKQFSMLPFRGEYYQLPPVHNGIVRHLIYPVPNPSLPFLGVHLTRMIDGSVTVGPNAVLAPGREAYGDWQWSKADIWSMLSYPGSYPLIGRYFRAGLAELRDSLFKGAYLKRVQKFCPSLQRQDLKPYPAGIRAQAVSPDGKLIDDFLFEQSPRCLLVCNAPSPAATSALPIADYILARLSLD